MKYYIYANNRYETLEEAESAVVSLKDILENKPSTYASIKRITGSHESGWKIPVEKLTDEEIKSSKDGFYKATSPYQSENYDGLTADEMRQKVLEYRRIYANWINANVITEITLIKPSKEDMSGYL